MKKEKCEVSQEDLERGYTEGEHKGEGLDDSPPNSRWRDLDDGGFLGRAKGQER